MFAGCGSRVLSLGFVSPSIQTSVHAYVRMYREYELSHVSIPTYRSDCCQRSTLFPENRELLNPSQGRQGLEVRSSSPESPGVSFRCRAKAVASVSSCCRHMCRHTHAHIHTYIYMYNMLSTIHIHEGMNTLLAHVILHPSATLNYHAMLDFIM